MSATTNDIFLVLGGTGMLGRQIAERLKARGDVVSVLDLVQRYNDDIPFYPGDIVDDGAVLSVIRKCGATCVFHAVSPHATTASEDSFRRVIAEGTKQVISACLAAGVRKLIFTGSSGVIYGGTDVNQADESLPYTTKSMGAYISSKILAEKAIIEANGKNDLLTTVLRPSGIFGPVIERPGDRQMINVLWSTYNNGRTRFQIGNNTNLVDWTYVTNVADAHILAADKLVADANPPVAGEVFFITNDEPQPFWDFSNGIWDRFDAIYPGSRIKKSPTIIPPVVAHFMALISETVAFLTRRKGDFTRFSIQFTYTARWHTIEKAKKALGYKPQVSLSEGMDRYVKWWVEQKNLESNEARNE